MSMVVEISTNDGDIGASSILRNALSKIFSGGTAGDTMKYIKNTKCRGILQNDINISFNNNWGQTAYQGIYAGLSSASNTKVFGTSLDLVKGVFDFAQTAANMGGVSMIGTGAASTRLYQGSSISGFNVTMKWYVPKDDTYINSLKALMILGFPSYRAPQTNYAKQEADGVLSYLPGVGGLIETLGEINDTFSSLASYNPPVVKVRVTDLNNVDSSGSDIFSLHPLVISSIALNASRETFTSNGKKLPIVISATVGFEFYQIRGNQGYTDDPLMIAGVSVLGPMNNG